MRKTIFTTALLAGTLAMPAYVSAQADPCGALSRLGGKVMEIRQQGVLMADIMDVARTSDQGLRPLYVAMVRDAYAKPRFSSAEYQQRAVVDYANAVYSACDSKRR